MPRSRQHILICQIPVTSSRRQSNPRKRRTGPGVESAAGACARLLFVDDEPSVRTSMVALCRAMEIEIEAVEDAAMALNRLNADSQRVVMTDLAMPGMDGCELTAAIKQ